MRSQPFTIGNMRGGCVVTFLILTFGGIAAGQRVSVIIPAGTPHDERYAEALSTALSTEGAIVIDRSLAESVFRSRSVDAPFNLTVVDARNIGIAIGCDYLMLVGGHNLRRASFSRPDYYQAFAGVYLVSSRTGRLIDWKLISFEGNTKDEAGASLLRSVSATAIGLIRKMRVHSALEINEPASKSIEEVPADGTAAAKGLRPPVPYLRIKPDYTQIASLHNVTATVDLLADVSATGEIIRTEVVRWAGFGLDESVVTTVKKMNWRPAMRNGQALPMRILLRYNFTKIEDDQ